MKLTKGISQKATEPEDKTTYVQQQKKLIESSLKQKLQHEATEQADQQTWKNLRSGLRVRNIINAKRMHEVKCKATNVE